MEISREEALEYAGLDDPPARCIYCKWTGHQSELLGDAAGYFTQCPQCHGYGTEVAGVHGYEPTIKQAGRNGKAEDGVTE